MPAPHQLLHQLQQSSAKQAMYEPLLPFPDCFPAVLCGCRLQETLGPGALAPLLGLVRGLRTNGKSCSLEKACGDIDCCMEVTGCILPFCPLSSPRLLLFPLVLLFHMFAPFFLSFSPFPSCPPFPYCPHVCPFLPLLFILISSLSPLSPTFLFPYLPFFPL